MVKKPTPEQKAVLRHDKNIVVTARPGSGKTYTVVEKIAAILPSLPDFKGVIAISFTNKASDELKIRCRQRGIDAKRSFFGTIDKFYISEIIIPFASHLTNNMPDYEVIDILAQYRNSVAGPAGTIRTVAKCIQSVPRMDKSRCMGANPFGPDRAGPGG